MDSGDHWDHTPHEETWRSFTKLLTYSVIGVVVTLGLLALLFL